MGEEIVITGLDDMDEWEGWPPRAVVGLSWGERTRGPLKALIPISSFGAGLILMRRFD